MATGKNIHRLYPETGLRRRRVSFKVAAATAQGRRHASAEMPCQDVVVAVAGPRFAAIALADGAGSASHAQQGAELVVIAVTRLLRSNFKRIVKAKAAAARQKIMLPLLRSLSAAARLRQVPLKSLACTLLFAATDGKSVLFGQLGDGRIGLQDAATAQWLALPGIAKGEFINETVFVTSRNASDWLQLALAPASAIKACVIMSDGAEESLYQRAAGVFAPAVSKMAEWVQTRDRPTVEAALQKNLAEVIRLKTTDDVGVGVLVLG